MGFGTEIFFFLALGLLVLGPKQLHTVIRHITRAKARFIETTRALQSQLVEELDDKQTENKG